MPRLHARSRLYEFGVTFEISPARSQRLRTVKVFYTAKAWLHGSMVTRASFLSLTPFCTLWSSAAHMADGETSDEIIRLNLVRQFRVNIAKTLNGWV